MDGLETTDGLENVCVPPPRRTEVRYQIAGLSKPISGKCHHIMSELAHDANWYGNSYDVTLSFVDRLAKSNMCVQNAMMCGFCKTVIKHYHSSSKIRAISLPMAVTSQRDARDLSADAGA
jgi:hypothetical protein